MANYKRGKCRHKSIHAQRGSETSWRARNNMKPVRVPDISHDGYDSRTWHASWEAWRRIYWPAGRHTPMRNWPAWWDRTFHTRPHRAKVRRLERKVMQGFDPDNIAWPLAKRPHIYYW